MTSSTFNAITYANKLKKAGLDTKIADVEAEELSNIINNDLVTKTHLSNELRTLEVNLLKWIVGISFTQMTLVIAVIGFILKH